jgi:microcystin degradation protein MlrC
MRVGILGIQHESNTFAATPTTEQAFRDRHWLEGKAVSDVMANTHHEVAGCFAGLAAADIEAVPLFFAQTTPSGPITAATCTALTDAALAALSDAGELDGLVLAPHGAGAGENAQYHDFDGHWTSAVRRQVGPELPIVTTIDPHANLSRAMVDASDAVIAYRTNPHLDQFARGEEAAALLARVLRGDVALTMSAAFPPIAINIERQHTPSAPCAPMYELADAIRQRPGVLSVSIVLGFPYADVAEMGTSFVVVTDDDRALGEACVEELAAHLTERRAEFVGEFISVDEAVAQAAALDGPVCLLDMGDNVGGGSAADGTFLAAALYEAGVSAYVCLCDADAVRAATAAGVGADLTLAMGGHTDDLHGVPLATAVKVVSLHAGQFHEDETRHGGQTEFDMGPTAVVRAGSLTVVLTSRRVAPFSLGMLTSCGLDPADFQVLVAKGVHAPVAAFTPVSKHLIRVNTPGSTAADMRLFEYQHRRRPLFPFEAE